MPSAFVLIDVSNSFTKIAFSTRERVGRVFRLPTPDLTPRRLRAVLKQRAFRHAVAATVVPAKKAVVAEAVGGEVCWVGPDIELGVGIDYPDPRSIGADRLANAAAAAILHAAPSVVVDFGTAVTFDVISADRSYIGGVIAPGLGVMTEYLHRRTAQLPLIELRQPPRAVGKSTREAMLSGAVHGYRGLIREILEQIRREHFPRRKARVIATGGDAELIGSGVALFDVIDPRLTLEGLRLIGGLNFPASARRSTPSSASAR
jgi:pantothenate kinase, type III